MATKHESKSTRVAYQVYFAVCNEIIERFLDRPFRFNKNKGTVVVHTDNNPGSIYTLFPIDYTDQKEKWDNFLIGDVTIKNSSELILNPWEEMKHCQPVRISQSLCKDILRIT
jgi:hypothetical protein